MKRIFLIFSILFYFAFCTSSANLSTSQIARLAKCKTISEISSIASSNGYKLAYKKEGAKGYEGYNVTDMAWSYNATYVPSLNSWDISGSFSAIKLLYNNTTKRPETIVYVVSDGSYFNLIRNQITSFGYSFFKEDTNIFPNAIAYCYYNKNLNMTAIFAEYYGNGGYQIHFFQD